MDRRIKARKLGQFGFALTSLSNKLHERDLDKEEEKGLKQLLSWIKELLTE